MRVMGFNFDKISIERLKDTVQDLKFVTNINVLDIDEIKTDMLRIKEMMIQVKFSFTVKYEPGFANVEIKGTVLLSMDEKDGKEVIKDWKKKIVPEGFKMAVFNIVLRKANLKAMTLEDDMNLPLHVHLPALVPPKDSEKDQDKKAKEK